MTREDNFHSTFVPQLATYAVWKFTTPSAPKQLANSSFPCFSLEFGNTKYTTFDFNGKATRGEQEFVLTIFFTICENRYADTRALRSDSITTVEQFINAPVYIPPTMVPGDLYCIDRAELIGVDGWRYIAGETRFVTHIKAKYLFSIFS
jgi:hypothetical protein